MYLQTGKRRGRPNKPPRPKKAWGRPRKERIELPGAEQRDVSITPVFQRNYECDATTVVNRGGTRSSKTYSRLQLMIDRAVTMPGRRILILRKTLPALRNSILSDFRRILDEYGITNRFKEEKQLLNFHYGKSLIHFGSLDDPQKMGSTGWNDVLLEEATEFTLEDFMFLKVRLSSPTLGHRVRNQICLDLNPIGELHWIKEKLVGQMPGLQEIVSTYKDNPFLPDEYVKDLESAREFDPNYWRIFGEGQWGKLTDLIWTNYQIVDYDMEGGDIIYGLDFGFNNPTVLLELVVDGYEAFIKEHVYQTRLTNADLIEKLEEIIPEDVREDRPIFADSAEPQRIQEINEAGFWCMPARKTKRVTKGKEQENSIDFVKKFKLYLTEESTNTLKEIRQYSYKKNKAGIILDEPIKLDDHAMDALRYGLYSYEDMRGDVRVSFY